MNKLFSAALAAGLLASTVAVAGLNPQSPGLPTSSAYTIVSTGLNGIPNNQASSMCVDCHTINPLARRSAGKYPTWQTAIANFRGSHYVGMGTNTGGGITWGSPTSRTGGQYLNLAQWTTAAARSKYGFDGAATAANYLSYATDTTVVRNATLDATAANYNTREMICESCHSIITNVAGGRNILGQTGAIDTTTGKVAGDATGNTGMCEVCHGDMTRANAKANNSPDGNNHHVVTLTTNAADQITNAKASTRLLWTRANVITGGDRTMSTGPTYSGLMLEVGYRVAATWTAGVAGKRAVFNCTDCHAFGHGGYTQYGARILRNGGGGAESGKAVNGTDRATDVASHIQMTIFENDQGFCQGCHTYAK